MLEPLTTFAADGLLKQIMSVQAYYGENCRKFCKLCLSEDTSSRLCINSATSYMGFSVHCVDIDEDYVSVLVDYTDLDEELAKLLKIKVSQLDEWLTLGETITERNEILKRLDAFRIMRDQPYYFIPSSPMIMPGTGGKGQVYGLKIGVPDELFPYIEQQENIRKHMFSKTRIPVSQKAQFAINDEIPLTKSEYIEVVL